MEVLGAAPVAEADHEAILVGGEGENRVALDHDALDLSLADGALELAEVGVPALRKSVISRAGVFFLLVFVFRRFKVCVVKRSSLVAAISWLRPHSIRL